MTIIAIQCRREIVAEKSLSLQSRQWSENSLAPRCPPNPCSFHLATRWRLDPCNKEIYTNYPPEWNFINDRNNSFTHLCANWQHIGNQIGVVLVQKTSNPNLLQFSTWQVDPKSPASSPLQLLLGWPWTHSTIHIPFCNHLARSSLPAPQRHCMAALLPKIRRHKFIWTS